MNPDDMAYDIPQPEPPNTPGVPLFWPLALIAITACVVRAAQGHGLIAPLSFGIVIAFFVGARVGSVWTRKSIQLDHDIALIKALPGGDQHE